MNTLAFDSLSVTKRLKSEGFSDAQAEAITREIQEVAKEDHLVSQSYLDEKLEKLELKIVNKVGAMFIGLGAFIAAIKFFS